MIKGPYPILFLKRVFAGYTGIIPLPGSSGPGPGGTGICGKASPQADMEKTLAEAYEIALRAGFRRVLADLHLFCGQVLCQSIGKGKKGKSEKSETQTLLGLKAHEHLEKTREYALDVSELSHLYPSADPGFYKGIPGYEMLKRGLTREERIKNGYFPAYQMAETLYKNFCH